MKTIAEAVVEVIIPDTSALNLIQISSMMGQICEPFENEITTTHSPTLSEPSRLPLVWRTTSSNVFLGRYGIVAWGIKKTELGHENVPTYQEISLLMYHKDKKVIISSSRAVDPFD